MDPVPVALPPVSQSFQPCHHLQVTQHSSTLKSQPSAPGSLGSKHSLSLHLLTPPSPQIHVSQDSRGGHLVFSPAQDLFSWKNSNFSWETCTAPWSLCFSGRIIGSQISSSPAQKHSDWFRDRYGLKSDQRDFSMSSATIIIGFAKLVRCKPSCHQLRRIFLKMKPTRRKARPTDKTVLPRISFEHLDPAMPCLKLVPRSFSDMIS